MCFSNLPKKVPNHYPEHNAPKREDAQDSDLAHPWEDLKNASHLLKKATLIASGLLTQPRRF